MGNWLSSTRTSLWKKHGVWARSTFHPAGGRRCLAGVGVWRPLQALPLYPLPWSPSKLLQYVLPGSSPEDHPGIEANAKWSPLTSAHSGYLSEPSTACGLWCRVPSR